MSAQQVKHGIAPDWRDLSIKTSKTAAYIYKYVQIFQAAKIYQNDFFLAPIKDLRLKFLKIPHTNIHLSHWSDGHTKKNI